METRQIIEKYLSYVLDHNEKPTSAYQFAKYLNITEGEFYKSFTSFEAIESAIWMGFYDTTIERLHADEAYEAFSAREKLLSFYYTWIEELLQHRSYVKYSYKNKDNFMSSAKNLKHLKEVFTNFASDIINEGKESKEINDLAWISDKYADGLWFQLLFVLNFWLNDNSDKFEKTDAAIEKAVNLSFELMGSNVLQSAFDFGKFILQK